MPKFNRKLYEENHQPNPLGSVDLSDTIPSNDTDLSINQSSEDIINESATDNTQPLDLSETQSIPVIIQPQKVVHVIPKWAKGLMIFTSFALLITLSAYMGKAFSDVPNNSVSVTKTAKEDQDSTKEFTAELKKTADATGTPYAITTEICIVKTRGPTNTID